MAQKHKVGHPGRRGLLSFVMALLASALQVNIIIRLRIGFFSNNMDVQCIVPGFIK